jgi:hypothetical protein
VESCVPVITHDGQLVAAVLVGRFPWLVATINQYLAPETVDQLNVGVVETPVVPFEGDESVGVVKAWAAPPKAILAATHSKNAILANQTVFIARRGVVGTLKAGSVFKRLESE